MAKRASSTLPPLRTRAGADFRRLTSPSPPPGPKLGGEVAAAITEGFDFATKQRADRNFSLKLKDVSLALHTHIWQAKVPLAAEDTYGRTYSIRWQLEGRMVCQAAWMKARGGAACRIGALAAQVMRGYSPAQRQCGELAQLELAVEQRRGMTENARKLWTIDWWALELQLHEWQPDTQAVRFRGQGYMWIHEHMYKRMATAASIEPLGYDAWRKTAAGGAAQTARGGQAAGV